MANKQNIDEQVYPKNIQLSEKIEFLMFMGEFRTNYNEHGELVCFYSSERLGGEKPFLKVAKRLRFLEFVNYLIDDCGLYPMLQKFIVFKDKKNFR